MNDIRGKPLKVGDLIANCVVVKGNKVRQKIGVIIKFEGNSIYTAKLPEAKRCYGDEVDEWILKNFRRGTSLVIKIADAEEFPTPELDKFKSESGG
jgi:hypothetical protein